MISRWWTWSRGLCNGYGKREWRPIGAATTPRHYIKYRAAFILTASASSLSSLNLATRSWLWTFIDVRSSTSKSAWITETWAQRQYALSRPTRNKTTIQSIHSLIHQSMLYDYAPAYNSIRSTPCCVARKFSAKLEMPNREQIKGSNTRVKIRTPAPYSFLFHHHGLLPTSNMVHETPNLWTRSTSDLQHTGNALTA